MTFLVHAIQPVLLNIGSPIGVPSSVQNHAGDFSQILLGKLTQMNQSLSQLDQKVANFSMGKAENIQEVVFAMEKARIEFQLMVQVRNKAVEAYQDIIKMQI